MIATDESHDVRTESQAILVEVIGSHARGPLTEDELDLMLASFDLVAPVTMADLAEIKRRIDERKAAGICSEVVLLADGRVQILVGDPRVHACKRTISARP